MECFECGEKIVGRADKKFCDDACRNSFNNKQNSDSTNYMRNVNNKLRKNFRILSSINKEGKTKTTKTKLTSKGFDFNFLTEMIVYKNGSEYKFVYNQGYKFLEEDWVLLVRKD